MAQMLQLRWLIVIAFIALTAVVIWRIPSFRTPAKVTELERRVKTDNQLRALLQVANDELMSLLKTQETVTTAELRSAVLNYYDGESKMISDGWGNEIAFSFALTKNDSARRGYWLEVRSAGVNGVDDSGSEDDVVLRADF